MMSAIPNTSSRVFYPHEMAALSQAFRSSVATMSAADDVRHGAKPLDFRAVVDDAAALPHEDVGIRAEDPVP